MISTIIGESSSDIPPRRNGGSARLSGPITGSVIRTRITRTVATGLFPAIGIQLKIIRPKIAKTNRLQMVHRILITKFQNNKGLRLKHGLINNAAHALEGVGVLPRRDSR